MTQNKELSRMKKWANALDVVVRVVSIITQIGCGVSAVLLIAMNFFSVVPNGDMIFELRVLGRVIEFTSLSGTVQTLIILLMIVICIFTLLMVRDLAKALHDVFQPMANGRPFEDSAVKGFRRAAIWSMIIAGMSMNGYLILIGILLLLFSYVFHYGVILQTESDETL